MNLRKGMVADMKELVVEGGKTISASSYQLIADKSTNFYVYIDSNEKDFITEAIVQGIHSFPKNFYLITELLEPGQNVLDLGAHIGTFSLFSAAYGYNVVSVEAASNNLVLLKESIRKNNFGNIQVVAAAICDHEGTLEFIQAGPYGLVANPHLDAPTISVPAITGDSLLSDIGWNNVDFIKMDIEGAEVSAIQGMSKLLAGDDAPTILYESNGHTLNYFGETPESLMASLEKFGYQCYLVESGRLIPTQSVDLLQPEVCVDYLATKRPLNRLGKWRIVEPMSDEERITKILATSLDPNIHARDYIVRALANASDSVLSDPRVQDVLKNAKLSQDEIAVVLELRRSLREKDAEIARLKDLIARYEQGRFMRLMKWWSQLKP
ncbi:MAG: FkbM family methyltransferase [Anaerolineae bacterium]|nr:FkbM family methyltransferase [Anaerolineae bacterium]